MSKKKKSKQEKEQSIQVPWCLVSQNFESLLDVDVWHLAYMAMAMAKSDLLCFSSVIVWIFSVVSLFICMDLSHASQFFVGLSLGLDKLTGFLQPASKPAGLMQRSWLQGQVAGATTPTPNPGIILGSNTNTNNNYYYYYYYYILRHLDYYYFIFYILFWGISRWLILWIIPDSGSPSFSNRHLAKRKIHHGTCMLCSCSCSCFDFFFLLMCGHER